MTPTVRNTASAPRTLPKVSRFGKAKCRPLRGAARDRYLDWFHGVDDAPAVEAPPPRRALSVPWCCCVCESWGTAVLGDTDILGIQAIQDCGGVLLPSATSSPLRDSDPGSASGILPRDCIVAGPCGNPDHGVCGQCVRDAVAAGVADPFTCMYAGGEKCRARFSPRDLWAFLDDDAFEDLAQRSLASLTARVACSACTGGMAVLPIAQAAPASWGRAVCDTCSALTCFHCEEPLTRCGIHLCRGGGAFNAFVAGGQPARPMARARDVTASRIRDLLDELDADDRGRLSCPGCLIPLQKTTDCNSLFHCGAERCNVCGEIAAAGCALPPEHWAKCPRYDFSPEWADLHGCTDYQCRGGVCHDDGRDCAEPSHEAGRAQMLAARKCIRRAALLKSDGPVSSSP